jgi:hypothetical protein
MKLRLARCKTCRAWKHKSEVSRVPMIVGRLYCHDCLSRGAAQKSATGQG